VSANLKILFQEISELTAPTCGRGEEECAQFKDKKYRCCEIKYCEATKKFAKEKYGIDLQPTGNPDLLYMGESGCTVDPYLRPICSIHACTACYAAKSNIDKDSEKTKMYFDLRKKIDEQSIKEGKDFHAKIC
jgi:hypothetical protein